MSLSVQGLRVFLSVLEHASFSAAGRELGMTQPAVSNHLHALEERFGVTLLVRGGRGARATPAGECLSDHARRVLEEIADLEGEMAHYAVPRGRLVVGASTSPGEVLIPQIAVQLSDRYPDVALDVQIADTDESIDALLKREVEVAVVGRGVDDPRLSGREIEQDELDPMIAASDPLASSEVAPEDLADRPFVMRGEGSATRRAAEEGLAAIGIVPSRTLSDHEQVRQLSVRGLSFVRPFVLIVERNRKLSPAAEAFVALCAEKKSL